jgi:hypothetical protein
MERNAELRFAQVEGAAVGWLIGEFFLPFI